MNYEHPAAIPPTPRIWRATGAGFYEDMSLADEPIQENNVSLFASCSKSLELEWLALYKENLCVAIKEVRANCGYSGNYAKGRAGDVAIVGLIDPRWRHNLGAYLVLGKRSIEGKSSCESRTGCSNEQLANGKRDCS
jgi:hypothetical protein